jgi:hypothetical protein
VVNKEFIVTGHLKEINSIERQTYMLHRSFMAMSKEQAIKNFHEYFSPDLEVIKIFSVIDEHGNVL